MAGLGDVFGKGTVGEQLFVWGLLSQIINALTGPGISELQQMTNSAFTNQPLSPSQLAALAVRGFTDKDSAYNEGAKSGLTAHNIDHLIQLAGEVPPPAALVEGYRRGLVGETANIGGGKTLIDALIEGGTKAEWAPLYAALAVQLPSWNDALDALLEGQLPRTEALHWYTLAGGDPDAFDWLFNTRGASPTPDMLGTMANRGIIPWDGTGAGTTTFAQGFLEGPWRNKWEPAMRRLQEYRPPPRTVTALLRSGAITQAEALTLFQHMGLTPELAAAYVKDASHTTAATHKELTKAEIESMLAGHLITEDQAKKLLTDLGFDQSHADLLVAGVALRRTISATNSAVTRVRTLYVTRKLQRSAAAKSLADLGINTAQATELLTTWDIEQSALVKQLTEAQITSAFHYTIITQDEASAELQAIGYTPWDAWVLLSTREHKALPGKPAPGPGPIAVV